MIAPQPISGLSAVKLALLAQRIRAENDSFALLASEPIAIVGLGCRFPGGADSPAAFWELLRAGVDAVRAVPPDRWDIDAYYDPDPDAAGKMTSRYGAFLERVDQFDAEFFGIAPREARRMDPQQRLLLEVAWEALEHAGLPPDSLAGSATGVFIGVCAQDFGLVQYNDPAQLDAYASPGTSHSIIANRLSYLLDLQGPSVAVDTACSSSLVTVHLACQSLRARECDLALAGGVNLMLLPEGMIALSRARMLAPDGRCKTFDAQADGYVRGEGCGLVVLKRLSDALRDGDPIWAVVRGSAVNQDGKSNGLTAPNLLAQQAVLRQALAQAQVAPETVGYVEAHGTGTALGDPIEVAALSAVYGAPRADGGRCLLGSVKTNLGHLEGAAGIAGLLKAVLALGQQAVPAHLHFHTLNPSISLEGTPFAIPTGLASWPATGQPRRAAVSAFGFGGTNAHLILEEAPALPSAATLLAGPQVLTLSAQNAGALEAMAGRYADFLAAPDAPGWADVCATSHQGRRHFAERLALVAPDAATAAERLSSWQASGHAPGVHVARAQAAPKVAFLFPGQGVALAGVGQALYERYPVFRAALDRCAAVLTPYLDAGLTAILWAPMDSELARMRAQTAFIQPALVALEWALCEQLAAWGVRPSAVLGHSVGEYAAAIVAGVVSLDDGLRLAAERGRRMQALPSGGAMTSVEADAERVTALLKQLGSDAVIAAVNAPTRTVVAGTSEAIAAVESACAQAGIGVRRLSVSHAFHSPLMAPMQAGFAEALAGVSYQPAQVTVVSGQWGRVVAPHERLAADYWQTQVRAPVQFADGVAALATLGCDVLVEVGPGGQLSGLGQLNWDGQPAEWVTPLRGKGDEVAGVLSGLGQLYTVGAALDWAAMDGATPHRALLPMYPFQRQVFPIERRTPARPSAAALPDLPWLGRRLPTALPATLFEATFSDEVAVLGEHRLYGTLVVPGAAYLTMALLAAASVTGRVACTLEGVSFREPLLLEADTAYTVQTILGREQDGARPVEIFSSRPPAGDWRLHSAGVIRSGPLVGAVPLTPSDRASILSRCAEELSGEQFYALMAAGNSRLGPSFQWVEQLHRGDGEALARLRPPRATERAGGDQVPPGLLDACFQVFGATWPSAERDPVVYVPVGLEQLNCFDAAAEAQWCYARLRPERAAGLFVGDLKLCDAAGLVLVEIIGLRVMAASRASLLRSQTANVADWIYGIRWQPLAMPDNRVPAPEAGSWLILADETGGGAALQHDLAAQGIANRLVRRDQLDLARPEALGEVLAAMAKAAPPCRAIVCLWPLAVPAEATAGAVATCTDVLLLTQALAQLSGRVVPRLWLVTRRAQAAGPDQAGVAAEQALLWGFGRTLARELPDLWGGLIDLDDVDPPAVALLTRLISTSPEDQVAVRAGQCYAARLERTGLTPEAQRRPLDPEGVYLITGGLGAVGLALAQWLVANGARRLALVGRHAEPNAATAELERQGAAVCVVPCDVTQADEVARLLARPELTGLRGIIHAAGVLDDGALVQLTPERMTSVLAPKVMGGWHLHQLTRGLALDFFVVCSSAAAVLGSAGQANYAAANAFLDALAHQRRASGLPALSVNWGPFAQAGMAARAQAAQPRRSSLPGLDPIELEQAGPILGRLLAQGLPQAAVLPIRARDLPRLIGPRSSLLAAAARQADLTEQPTAGLPAELVRRLAEAHPAHRAQIVLTSVIAQAASVLLLPATQTLDPRRPLREYGLDSLMALDLSAALSRVIGRKLPATLVYEQPTAEALAAYLARELGLEAPAPTVPADDQRSAAIAEVQHLSEKELDEFVNETLKSL